MADLLEGSGDRPEDRQLFGFAEWPQNSLPLVVKPAPTCLVTVGTKDVAILMEEKNLESMISAQARALFEGLRCHQWIKNLFVFAAPVFGEKMFEIEHLASACVAFVAMCFASSATYLFNDLNDLEQDKLHPQKTGRPLASGRLKPRTAIYALLMLGVMAVTLTFTLTPASTGITILFYFGLNILYSLWLKHIVILDVMSIALGFILRIMVGAFAVSVAPSYWLFLCTINVALFLGFGKRRAELATLKEDAPSHRGVLEHYSLAFIDQMIAIVSGATLVCYILYTVDPRTVQVFGTHMLVLTVPFVMYGLFRYLHLLYHLDKGGSPTRAILFDNAFLVNIVLWVITCIIIIYTNLSAHDLFV